MHTLATVDSRPVRVDALVQVLHLTHAPSGPTVRALHVLSITECCYGSYALIPTSVIKSDKRKGLMSFTLHSDVQEMTIGPVEATFQMYFDFATFEGNGI